MATLLQLVSVRRFLGRRVASLADVFRPAPLSRDICLRPRPDVASESADVASESADVASESADVASEAEGRERAKSGALLIRNSRFSTGCVVLRFQRVYRAKRVCGASVFLHHYRQGGRWRSGGFGIKTSRPARSSPHNIFGCRLYRYRRSLERRQVERIFQEG